MGTSEDSSREGGNGSSAYYRQTKGSSVQVTTRVLSKPAARGRALIILSFSFLLVFSMFASTASAITRSDVVARANSWVKRRVPYSQRGTYGGYRRDCSGFVSMAWKLNRSYTTRTISAKARRISVSSLKPGDAVLTRGHVAIFGGWKNKARRQYIAIEQTTWGSHAKRRVRRIPKRAVALTRRGITSPPRASAVKIPAAAVASVPTSTAGSLIGVAWIPTSGPISTTFTVASIVASMEASSTAPVLVSMRSVDSQSMIV